MVAKKRKSRPGPEDSPNVRRLRELYAKGMAELQARRGVSSIDDLEMSDEARRLHGLVAEGAERRSRRD
jgi:hypothetical protein